VNTFDAHRLLAWAGATDLDLQAALAVRLFRAYFTDGQNVADATTLRAAAADVGLDAEAAAEVLASHAFDEEVINDRTEAIELGITGVPAFVIDGQWAIPGAQEVETFVRLFQRAREKLG
jgi:predicted DsbA family dithiol-disulfide isomerase